MIDRTVKDSQVPNLLSIKSVLARVKTDISMRSLTSAIRQYCLEQRQANNKDVLLAFFLNCEKRLKRSTPHEWTRVIEAEIRKMVGLDRLSLFLRNRYNSVFFTQLKLADPCLELEQRINEELGEMEICEDVRVKTKYFFQWFQYLQERKEIRRLKNKEVEDLKKSKLFCQYSLKFQTFLQWKQQVRKAKTERERIAQIQSSVAKRTATSIFLHFREKIDILHIQSQLEQAVRQRLDQLELRLVFGKLRVNRASEQVKAQFLKKHQNVWIFRFYKYLTHRLHPLQNRSSVENRKNLQQLSERLNLQLCWKGLRQQLQQTQAKVLKIRKLRRNRAISDFKFLQLKRKVVKRGLHSLRLLQKSIYLKEFTENVEAGNQTEIQYSQKMSIIQSRQLQSRSKHFYSTLTCKCQAVKEVRMKRNSFLLHSAQLKKRMLFSCLSEFKQKKINHLVKSEKALFYVSFKFFTFSYQQYLSHKLTQIGLRGELKQKHDRHLLKRSFKGLSLYRSVKVTEYGAINSIFTTLRLKTLSQSFQKLKRTTELSSKLERLASKSEWIMLKVSFITILNRMLSNKMKMKNFNEQQGLKLKGKLFELLKFNCAFMASQRANVQKVALEYSKRRLILNLRKDLQYSRSEYQAEKIHQKANKRQFFRIILGERTLKDERETKRSQVCQMLVASRMMDFTSSARQFIEYRETENRLTYKLQKSLVRGILKNMRRRVNQMQEERETQLHLRHSAEEKVTLVKNLLTTKCLTWLLRLKTSTLDQKQLKIKIGRAKSVFDELRMHKKEVSLRKELHLKGKFEFLEVLRTHLELKKGKRLFSKKVNKQKLKTSLSTMQLNIESITQTREEKALQLKLWLDQNRTFTLKNDFLGKLQTAADLKENSLILANTLLKGKFQKLVRSHLNQRSRAIKEIVALRLYASNLKARALRGLKRASDFGVLKENRTRTEHHSKLSMEHMRKKSKLLETIERYNHSRISRVVR